MLCQQIEGGTDCGMLLYGFLLIGEKAPEKLFNVNMLNFSYYLWAAHVNTPSLSVRSQIVLWYQELN